MEKIIKFPKAYTKVDKIDIRTTNIKVVEINNYRFELDEEIPWINIFKNIEDVRFDFISDIDVLDDDCNELVRNLDELKKFSIKWYLENIGISKE